MRAVAIVVLCNAELTASLFSKISFHDRFQRHVRKRGM
jgi:hypothetical protein